MYDELLDPFRFFLQVIGYDIPSLASIENFTWLFGILVGFRAYGDEARSVHFSPGLQTKLSMLTQGSFGDRCLPGTVASGPFSKNSFTRSAAWTDFLRSSTNV